ncbi:hypothetical protein C8R45DRAFT_1105941 [Mycena sanguinolenta]|nr:hypothetical protein C8R45DRAFT_1105941 [Mycena sanguinolenta]
MDAQSTSEARDKDPWRRLNTLSQPHERDTLQAKVERLEETIVRKHEQLEDLRWARVLDRKSKDAEIETLKKRLAASKSENARLMEENKKFVDSHRAARLAAQKAMEAMEALQSEFVDDAPNAGNDLAPPRKRRRSEGSSLAKDAPEEAHPRRSQRSTIALPASA